MIKSRIINGVPVSKYDQSWIERNLEEFINGDFVKNWVFAPEYNDDFLSPFWDGNKYIELATPEEIEIANKPIVPCSISRMRLKLELFERGITVEEIAETINTIPNALFSEFEKQKALIKFQEATSYDRYNADLNLVATLMGLSQEDLDSIFINGNL